MSREAAIAHDVVVFTGELDHDVVSYDATATNAARASRPARAVVFFDRRAGYVRLSGRVSFADGKRVAP